MIVHFACQIANLQSEMPNLRAIQETVHSLGHSFAHDWIETEYLRQTRKSQRVKDWQQICDENFQAIEFADLTIFETSDSSCFGVGYQAAYAVGLGKPVLLLAKESERLGAFYWGLRHPSITRRVYRDGTELQKIISNFLVQT